MGTRGNYGFRVNGIDKVTYNHFDSYPGVLGEGILEFIAETPIEELKVIAEKIKMVGEKDEIDPVHYTKFKKYEDQSAGSPNTYYRLLRETQGVLGFYKKDLDIMIGDKDFLHNGLFCEYAYIINIDTGMLEFYRGFYKNKVKGRYNLPPGKRRNGYNGVSLRMEIPLKEITASTIGEWSSKMDGEVK